MNLKKITIICILCLLFISSCVNNINNYQTSDSYPVDDEYVSQDTQDYYENNSAYPVNEEISQEDKLPERISIPDPSPETAVVHGKLLSLSQTNEPYIAPSLFLGEILIPENNDEEEVFLGSISIEDDPQAQQSQNGDFLFTNVPPGSYGLFVWTPVSAFIVEDEKTSQPTIIDVKAGEIYDLGTIYVP